MKPIVVEIIAPMLTAVEFGCSRCEVVFSQTGTPNHYRRACADEFPEDWKKESARLTEMLSRLTELYKHRVVFRLTDAQSLAGLWKQIRYRVRQLPVFIVESKDICVGLSLDRLEGLIDRHIRQRS